MKRALLLLLLAPASSFAETIELSNACDQTFTEPLAKYGKPRLPASPGQLASDTQKLSDDDSNRLAFDNFCGETRRGGAQVCDQALAYSLKAYRDERDAFTVQLKETCKKKSAEIAGCKNASGAEQYRCLGKVYDDFKQPFDVLKRRAEESKSRLRELQRKNLILAKAALNANPPKDERRRKTADAMIANEESRIRFLDRSDLFQRCQRDVATRSAFCGHLVASSDARHYADGLDEVASIANTRRENFDRLSAENNRLAENLGSAGGENKDKEKSKGGLFGMDMNDMIKMGTLGVTGASLYCSMTKNCSPQNNTASSVSTDTSTAPLLGATSPTPNSTKEAEKKFDEENKSAAASKPAPEHSTPFDAESGKGISYHTGGNGFGKEGSSLSGPGNGESKGGAAPALVGSVGGGGSAALSGGNLGTDHPGASAAESNRIPASDGGLGGLGSSMGSSMPSFGSSSTGFNLGDTHSATPTDTALKDILNGEPSPGGSLDGLGGIGDPLAGAAGSAGEAGADDPDNLFLRVRGTHVRCLKRGCVGHEVGKNI